MARIIYFISVFIILLINIILGNWWTIYVWWSMVIFLPLMVLGAWDMIQTSHAILRNFPIVGHFRYLLEAVRPEIYQYFIESNNDGKPFNREERSLVYARAKNVRDTVPFGSQEEMYEEGYEWVSHSLKPIHVAPETLRVTIGGADCTQPYSASILNISAMSFGSLSSHAILALSQGAQMGHFAHNTGEGGISDYHIKGGGDLIWQIGTGYFGCRTSAGNFCPDSFAKKAGSDQVKMIEIKISQGAKPGHGGILPGIKVSSEIAKVRQVPEGKTVISPPAHTAFTSPPELLNFIAQLRKLSNGKPIGFKLCLGKRHQFLSICKAMHETNIYPDFISVDGAEGGTGAAPLEFANFIGYPLTDGLIFIHNALIGFDLRSKISIIASGKVIDAFSIIKRIALGADLCYSARGMMMSLGCIQALRCHTNDCPTGVATQNKSLVGGLVVSQKNKRVYHFHKTTVETVADMLGAMGKSHTNELMPWNVNRRIDHSIANHFGALYPTIEMGSLLPTSKAIPKQYADALTRANSQSW
jgi:glutamate synthase domain-containing protein 2